MFGKTWSGSRRAAIVLVTLALATSAMLRYPSPAVQANPSTLRVGGVGGYSSIQAAVDAALPGDTILVEAGTYAEHVVITKQISLLGVSPSNTTIDGSGSGTVVNVTGTSGVLISGFSIRNTGIYDNGILVWMSSNVTIRGNIVHANLQTNGTWILNSDSAVVQGNVFSGSAYGVSVLGGFGNLIQDNNMTGNPDADVYIAGSSGNKVADNSLRGSLTGLQLWYGAVGNVVVRNLIANNTSEGIFLLDSPQAGNLFVENRIEFNNAFNDTTGVNIQNSTLNRFYHNTILNNTYQMFGVKGGDIPGNYWDNATGDPLKSDAKIMFVDSNSNLGWNANETVVYDTNGDGLYDAGDVLVASVGGARPANATLLTHDSRIRFVDLAGSGVWRSGDPVVYDANGNGVFDAGEPAIAGVGGNYWSNYQGSDNGANGFAGDGIGDTLIPTPCPNGGRPCSNLPGSQSAGVDWYPLMRKWQSSGLNITASASPLGGPVPLQVSFRGVVTGGLGPYGYSWSFGDGSTMVGQNVTHVFVAVGAFIVTLSVVDSASTAGSSEVSVTVLANVGNMVLMVVDQAQVAVKGANVTVLSAPQGQGRLSGLTDASGSVSFDGVAVGTYGVQASAPGFVTVSKNVTVVFGQTTSQSLVLSRIVVPGSPPSYALYGVIGVVVAAVAVLGVLVFWRRRGAVRAKRAV